MPKIIAFRCVNPECQAEFPEPHFDGCPQCRLKNIPANLYAIYEPDSRSPEQIKKAWQSASGRGLWRFADRLPDIKPQYQLSLGEGNTPLISLTKLARKFGLAQLWLKNEAQNPTWSWKDRLMAVAVSAGLSDGATAIAGSSTGNAGAALAAYASRGGLASYIFATKPISPAMQALMQSYGAHLFVVPSREDRFRMVKLGMAERGWYPVTNLAEPPLGSNSYGLEGYKTLAFEIALTLDFALPDLVLIPTSNGDGLFGIWRGFVELKTLGLSSTVPQMMAIRPANSKTVAFSLGKPPESLQVSLALQESGGQTVFVNEDDIIAMQLTLAKEEGLYLEAASVVGLCALKQLSLPQNAQVVVVGTSTGLKDPQTTLENLPPVPEIEPTLAALEKEQAGLQ